jgi:hypothetical protein
MYDNAGFCNKNVQPFRKPIVTSKIVLSLFSDFLHKNE